MGDVKPQDADSGLVARRWERTGRKGGVLTEETLEGKEVAATWLDRQGRVQRAQGTVVRSDQGELAIEGWADGVRRRSTVTRDADVDVIPRR